MNSLPIRSYPLLPLKRTVILPGCEVGLTVGRPRSLAAVAAAIGGDGLLIASTQHNGEDNEPLPEGLNRVGTLLRLISWERRPGGTMQVVVTGVGRVVAHSVNLGAPSYSACVEPVVEPRSPSTVEHVLQGYVVDLYLKRAEVKGHTLSEVRDALDPLTEPGELADFLANELIADWEDRQNYLNLFPPTDRLERLAVLLTGEAELSDLETTIRSRVRQQIDKSQREYYLREQLKVIHDELSDESGSEIEALRARIHAGGLPEEAREKALREVNRLERTPSSSPEGGVIRSYLDWVLALPWNSRSEDTYDLVQTERILEEDHHGLEKVKERIVEFLAVRELTARRGDQPRSPILCFVGPPGVGKTSLGQSIARSLGRRFVRISLGGVRDEAEVRGHRRTYVGALPGRLIHGLRSAATNNPVMLLDEIDKMSADYKGDPSSAMLEVLDPEQNSRFVDHYLELPFDLSQVLFVATANSLESIPRPLLDRMEVIQFGGYTEDEKLRIAKRHLLPRQLRSHGLDPRALEVSDNMLRQIIRGHTREAGVRNLERQLGAVCRKSARRLLSGRSRRIRLSAGLLREYLGPGRRPFDSRPRTDQVGVVMGMAWTEVGGTLLPVEVANLPGKGALTLTGSLGDVMQESAKAALCFARSRAEDLGIPTDFQETTDWHIHLPEGAVPKDGPSAGITMATGMISALTGRAVRSDVAMTGEVTLRGRVLQIGGLKEKALAAHQAGIKRVVAPRDNEAEFDQLPRKLRRELEFHWVESMDEVLRLALAPTTDALPANIVVLNQPVGYEVSVRPRGE
jgi:ATP-dependent Lon protease